MKLDRLLIDKIENRILVGIVCFVGIMVIIGWIGLNEPARMSAFSEQYAGRSIERGAYLFNQNCSTCHGKDGLGIGNRGPGLNNPHMFGWDPVAAERTAIDNAERNLGVIEAIVEEYDTLSAQIANGELEGDALTAAQNRVAALQARYDGAAEEIATLEGEIVAAEAAIEAAIVQLETAIANGYDIDTPERLSQVGWEGSLRSYVYTTLVHGRPGSQNYWATGQGMAAWGQVAGGPLRADQLDDLTNYIMNWDKGSNWTVDDLNNVQQYAKIPVDAALAAVAAPSGDVELVGTDVDDIVAGLADYTGDPNNGQTIYNGIYGCAGCHGNAVVAPLTENTWLSAVNGERGAANASDPTRYIVESIVQPGNYIVEGYMAGAMPANFGERMSYQDMADILAYLQSYDG